jgi:tetratricopeptide (TPR) repeat protein
MSATQRKGKPIKPKPVEIKPHPAAGDLTAGGEQKIFYAGAILAFVLSLALYLRTMAVSASFWDAGEFIASAYILGVPHSPGTPLYVLVGRVFTMLPIPLTVAQKVNLLSSLCGALGVLFVYILIVKFLDYILGKSTSVEQSIIKVVGGLVGALVLAASDTFWINAIEAEVYAMSCFLMGFMTWLGLKWEENPGSHKATLLIYLLFYLLALSVGFHLGTILAFSGIFFFVWLTANKAFSNLEFLIACIGVGIFVADATLYREGQATLVMLVIYLGVVAWLIKSRSPFAAICSGLFILGLSVHLYMLIRSGHNPAIDEGSPETWRSLYFALRREQYPPMNVFARKASIVFQFQHFTGYFYNQFQFLPLIIGKTNISALLPIGLGVWGMVDHFSKHKKSFIMLFVTFLITSIGLLLFLNFSDDEVRDRDYFYSPAFYYFAVFIGIGAASVLNEIKGAYQNKETSSRPILIIVGVVMLAIPFLAARHQFFSHDRSNNYTCRDYAINMLKPLEENSIIFTNGDNDTFPLWYIQEVENFRKDIRVVNLSLLNTPWYIKQLRDNEPTVPISWTDAKIDELQPVLTKQGWRLVRDIAVQHILLENRWKKPIYFAVTIPPETYAPYRDYLEMQGLAYLLVQKKGKNMINEEILEDNVYNQFSFRSILTSDWKKDDSVYLPKHTRHLIQNYAAAFIQLGYIQQYDPQKSLKAFKVAKEISPDIEPVVQLLGRVYLQAGDTLKALQHYQDMVERHPQKLSLYLHLAEMYERIGEYDKAINTLDILIEKDPGDRQAFLSAFGLAVRADALQRGRNYLVRWLNAHPNDEEVRRQLDEFDNALKNFPRPGDSTQSEE